MSYRGGAERGRSIQTPRPRCADTSTAGGRCSDITFNNALLEAALTHARNLFDFFDPPEHSKPDDIIAAHLMPKGTEWTPPAWQVVVGKPEPVTGARDMDQPLRIQINKRLAHMTYTEESWEGDDRGHDMPRLVSLIEEPLRRFVANADQCLLSNRWRDACVWFARMRVNSGSV
jgi:hypothetical protein